MIRVYSNVLNMISSSVGPIVRSDSMIQNFLYSLMQPLSPTSAQAMLATVCAFIVGTLFLYRIHQKRLYRNSTESSLKKIQRNRHQKY